MKQPQLILFVAIFVLGQAEKDIENGDMCNRYSALELKESLFNQQLARELEVIRLAFDLTFADLGDLVTGLEGKETGKIDAQEIRKAIGNIKEEIKPLFQHAKSVTDKAWIKVFEPYDGDKSYEERPLTDFRLLFQRIHQEIHFIHKSFEKPFDDLAKATKAVMDPMIRVLQMFMAQTAANDAAKRGEMLDALTQKSRFLGLAVKEIMTAQFEDRELPVIDFVPHLNDFWSQFTVAYYHGIGDEEEHDIFWPKALAKIYAYNTNWDCDPAKVKGEAECKRVQAVRLVSSLLYHTEGDVDNDWMKDLDKLKDKFDEAKKVKQDQDKMAD